jgi:tetratricopeptide (TPR) repeat protein
MSLLHSDPQWGLFCSRAEPRAATARWACLLLSCALCLAAPHRAWAEGQAAVAAPGSAREQNHDVSEPDGYRALVEEGLSEFSVHHYEEARALFARAHALFPNARTHRALGLAAFELRNYVEAANHFELALSSQLRPLDASLRKQAEGLLERAYGFVGRVQVLLQPALATLALDGQAVVLPANGILLMRIGEHALEAQAAGFAKQKQRIEITGGEQLTVNIHLLPLAQSAVAAVAGAQTSPAHKVDQAPARRAWYKSPWLWTSVGIVVAGAAAAGALVATRDPAAQEPYLGTSDTVVKAP